MRSIRVKEQGRKNGGWRVVVGWVTVSALLLVIGSGCGHESKDKAKEGESKKDEALEVSTTSPKTQLLRRYILQPGILKSYEETPIYTKLAGFLQPITVDIGDRITKGELLAELWVPEVAEAVRVKQSKVEEGKADVTQAEETLKAAEANIVTWQARVDEAKASVIRTQALLFRWDEEYKRNLDYKLVDPKDPKKDWFKLTDQVLAVLKTESVPESVLMKLRPMKDKMLSRNDFVSDIDKLLNADETRQFQTLILSHAPRKLGFLDSKSVEETEKQRDASKAAVKETEAGVKSAEASLAESKAKRDRAAADVQVNKTQLVVWERELEYQKRWFEYSRITAPYDGIITRRIVHKGHFVQPTNSGTTSMAAEPLFVVMRTDIIRVVIQVPEYDAPLVKDGADAVVRLQAYRGQEIKCKVKRSSWALDKDARTLRVEIWLDNPPWFNLTDRVLTALQKENVPDAVLAKLAPLKNKELSQGDFVNEITKVLKVDEMKQFKDIILKRADSPSAPMKLQAGMYGNISITADVPNALCLPAEAILTDGNRNYCFVIENGKTKRVNVKIGVTNDKMTEILTKQAPPTKLGEEGAWVKFTGSEQVITSNLKSIQDGQPVKAK